MRLASTIIVNGYHSLQDARNSHLLNFEYEPPFRLPIDDRMIEVHPDFVIHSGGKTFYWEHLGMLDRQDYNQLWRARRTGYDKEGLEQALITTDDLNGVRQEHRTGDSRHHVGPAGRRRERILTPPLQSMTHGLL